MRPTTNLLDADATSIGDAIDFLQQYIDDGNAANGFNEEAERLEIELNNQEVMYGHMTPAPESLQRAREALRNFQVTQVALVTTEAAEAIEEIRSGHAANETYYPTKSKVALLSTDAIADKAAPTATELERGFQAAEALSGVLTVDDGLPHKPEGFPSEVADAAIRLFHIAARSHFSLGRAIAEKLAYNATRPRKHGREF